MESESKDFDNAQQSGNGTITADCPHNGFSLVSIFVS